MKVVASLWWDSYPNSPISEWEADFNDSTKALEYVRMLSYNNKGVNVLSSNEDEVIIRVFADDGNRW